MIKRITPEPFEEIYCDIPGCRVRSILDSGIPRVGQWEQVTFTSVGAPDIITQKHLCFGHSAGCVPTAVRAWGETAGYN